VFLSPVFLDSIGCVDQCAESGSAIQVTTSDGQVPRPTATKLDDGYLVDLGIDHFSAPNPLVQTTKIADPVVRDRPWASSFTDFPLVTATAATTTSKYAKTVKLKKKRSVSTRSIFVPSKKYSAKWTTTGGCRIVGSRLVARSSKGRCTAKLTERKGRKTARTRVALVMVS
jgi:hypothetical protein